MKPIEAVIGISLLAASFWGGWYAATRSPGLSSPNQYSRTQDLTDSRINRIVCQGRIVPFGGLINVVSPSGQRIVDIKVANGQSVKAGETELATYEGQEILALQSDLAISKIEDQKKDIEQKIRVAEGSYVAAENAWSIAKAQLEQANSILGLEVSEKQLQAAVEKLDRLRKLASDPQTKNYVSQTSVDEQSLVIEQSRIQLQNARLQKDNAIRSATLNLVVAVDAKDQAKIALDLLLALQKENRTLLLSQQITNTQTKNSKLTSPIDGEVLKIFGKPGETVLNSPLMQLGDLSKMVCVAEVLDRLVSKIQPKQRVIISSPALPKPIGGSVSEIGNVVGNITLMPPNPLAMVDQKTVEVTIEIDEQDNEIARTLVNLQARVEILIAGTLESTSD